MVCNPRVPVSPSPRVIFGRGIFWRRMHFSWAAAALPATANYSVKPATAIDPATRRMNYWFDKPANDSVADSNYDALWNAANQAAVDHSFTADLIDYREGRLTTRPLISRQPLELWKHDVIDPKSQLDCMLSTMRRTGRIPHYAGREDGAYRLRAQGSRRAIRDAREKNHLGGGIPGSIFHPPPGDQWGQ